MATAPQLPPAQPWDTRTQLELSLLFVAFPVLGEADHDPAPFIAIDLLTRRPADGRHVRAVHTGLFERMGGPLGFGGNKLGGLLIARALMDARFLSTAGCPGSVRGPRGYPA